MTIARDRFPEFVRWLGERTGIHVPLNRLGIIELASSSDDQPSTGTPLSGSEVGALEPSLGDARAAVLHEHDGAVDVRRLLQAMAEAAACEWSIQVTEDRAARLEWSGEHPRLLTEEGERHEGDSVVIAAGAWTSLIDGLPRRLRVEPVRGQMLSLEASPAPLRHAISASEAYLVPRGDAILVGSTLERVGFDARTTDGALQRLRAAAVRTIPALANARVLDSWAGLRPMTPDALPILGNDPDYPRLIYACGHGKNGILLAPLTGECIASLLTGSRPAVDLASFSVARFDATRPIT